MRAMRGAKEGDGKLPNEYANRHRRHIAAMVADRAPLQLPARPQDADTIDTMGAIYAGQA